MALLKCCECGKEISEYAKTCPHCGSPNFDKIKKDQTINFEKNRIKDIHKNIEYYQKEICKSIVLLIISLALSVLMSKNDMSNIWINFLPCVILCFWGKILIPIWWRWQSGFYYLIGSLIGTFIILLFLVSIISSLPPFLQLLISMLLILYPLYCAFIKPIISIKRINEEKIKI